jgi:isopentenyl-diphosphate Delta-isomerase
MVPDLVTLVDRDDNVVGAEEKIRAHREGKLHRAFSVFVFDEDRRLLIQRRATGKYHSAGLWSNTCCGHPRPGESTGNAAARRLPEEMGFSCQLRHAFQVVYRADLDNSLVEHELDRVYVGRFSGVPRPNPLEVDATMWVAPEELRSRILEEPHRYTAWLRLLLLDDGWAAVDEFLGVSMRLSAPF